MSLIFLLILLVLAWVVLILPKQRELKRHNALVASLEVGDEVMSGSGLYGTITEMTDDAVLLSIAPGVEVKVARRAVAAKVPPPDMDEPAALDATAGGHEALAGADDEPAADEPSGPEPGRPEHDDTDGER